MSASETRTLCLAGLLLCLAAPAQVLRGGGWPTDGGDSRRTGQADVVGPSSPARTNSFAAPNEVAINVSATIGDDGTLYFGTWGAIRSNGVEDRTLWNKFDGKLYAVGPDLVPVWGAPFPGDPVPFCYDFPGRPRTPGSCPAGGTVSFYNGTVEGTAAFNSDQSVLYVGRGDGKLYAVEAASGSERWVFETFNPEDPADPDGGGEVVAGPLVGSDGTIYIVTIAAGEFESNAVYAVTPDGALKWRYPHSAKGRDNTFWTGPALSPDGGTMYVAGAWGPAADDWDTSLPGAILAFDLSAAGGTGDERLKWEHFPVNENLFFRPTVWSTSLAVGSDGTIYASGPQFNLFGSTPVLFALRDLGDRAEQAWDRMVDLDPGRAVLTFGIALREVDGVTRRVYASSGSVPSILAQGYLAGGKLYAVDPQTGDELWDSPFDPEEHGGFGSMSGIVLGVDGTIYTGASGQRDSGRIYAIGENGGLLWDYEVGGLLEWAHPVLGPEGDLYFADTRRSLCTLLPLESGACQNENIEPRLYVIHGTGSDPPAGPCELGPETHCLNGGRFRVEVEWTDFNGNSGPGRVVPAPSEDSGLFWFFDADNWEMLVKILDGCGVNGHRWVFAAATTSVEYTLRVTDTETGTTREYHNPLGTSSVATTDTGAFAACP